MVVILIFKVYSILSAILRSSSYERSLDSIYAYSLSFQIIVVIVTP